MFAGHDVALPIDRNIFNFAFIAVVPDFFEAQFHEMAPTRKVLEGVVVIRVLFQSIAF
jgi:hypothetical protein